ncbi:Uma2 family endonuclease [Pseudaquabacterium terrae]|nr:Uma2 family endonuclease [Aquabacterium terrae]
MTAEEFLAWDESQPIRHEFLRGEVYAMAGGEDRHATLALNFAMALRGHLQGSPCRTYINDVKLRVAPADAYFYPDVMVTCSAVDAAHRLIKSEPLLVIEVLSPGTAGYDRGDKFAAYRMLASLREYVLADPRSRRCDVHRRGDDGLWILHPFDAAEGVHLASVELSIDAETLWAEVEPGAAPGAMI